VPDMILTGPLVSVSAMSHVEGGCLEKLGCVVYVAVGCTTPPTGVETVENRLKACAIGRITIRLKHIDSENTKLPH
jgi:hypothetical protein